MSGHVKAEKHPTLYLLHGLSDDHTIWLRRTSIERYAADLGLAVVMPAVHRSYYQDMANGLNYWTFVSEELPAIAQSFFPLSQQREDNYVAGLSMGGYGAFKLALNHPERFAAAASLSGALAIEGIFDRNISDSRLIFGDKSRIAGSSSDLFTAAERLAHSDQPKPLLYQYCGTEDFLYEENIKFRNHAQALGLPLTYTEAPGDHQWTYWDEYIQHVLKWLPLSR
jgi:S-formylglutathione hydrolase FrmB